MHPYFRRKVNNIVHSFCYRCRNWQSTGDWNWPFVLSWGKDYPLGPTARQNKRAKDYIYFLSYATQQILERGWSLSQLLSIMQQLEIRTCKWTEEEFTYANQLLVKYYGVET